MKKVVAEKRRKIDFSRARRGQVIKPPPGKTKISIRLDKAILEHFRRLVDEAGGGNYQTLINDALLEHIHGQSTLQSVRQVLREELSPYEPAGRVASQHAGDQLPATSLAGRLTAVMSTAWTTASTPTLFRLEPVALSRFELGAQSDRYLKAIVRAMSSSAERLERDPHDLEAVLALKDRYIEAVCYQEIKEIEPSAVAVRRSSAQAPDFAVTLPDGRLFIEVKALNVLGGQWKQKEILEGSLAANIRREEQVAAGRRVAISEQVLQPYRVDGKPYNPCSTAMVIHALIAKIANTLKPGQFDMGDTLLAVDLGELPLISEAHDSLKPSYKDNETGASVTGELFRVAFGRAGQPITKPPEFEGAKGDDGVQATNGILVDHQYVKGLLFRIGERWYGILDRSKNRVGTVAFVQRLAVACRLSQ